MQKRQALSQWNSTVTAMSLKRAHENDKIVVFGSFLTVGEAMAWLQNNNKTSKR